MSELAWEDVPARVDDLVLLVADPAWAVKRAAADVYPRDEVGYFLQPELDCCAVSATTPADVYLAKSAAARALGRDAIYEVPLTDEEAASGYWVKVAYSPGLRRAAEALNFIKGTYPGGLPNAASPLAAMLTTSLVGGGIGYGMGRLGEAVLPRKWERGKLRRTGAMLGAAAGALPAIPWMYGNVQSGHGITEPWPLDAKIPEVEKQGGLDRVVLGDAYCRAVDEFVKSAEGYFGDYRAAERAGPADVNVNALGQTLWESGAPPSLTAATMGSMYAAAQFPDPEARPGWVTGGQLGQLALGAGKGYVEGVLVGKALSALTGMPTQGFGAGGAVLGIIGTVIPRLFH